MKQTYEEQSECCGAEVTEIATDDYICHECKEHCEVIIIDEDDDEQDHKDYKADLDNQSIKDDEIN